MKKKKPNRVDLFALSKKEIEKIKAPDIFGGDDLCKCESSGGGLAKVGAQQDAPVGFNYQMVPIFGNG